MSIDEDDVRRSPEVRGTGLGLVKGLGVTLKEANCTVCWKCSRECPDWCIYIETHKETHDPASGGKARSVKVLDRFAIDYALCMYCGICVEVCPFDALFWSPEFEYSEYDIVELVHEKEKLEEWTYTVLPPPELEEGAEPAQEVAPPSTVAAPPTAPARAIAAEPPAPSGAAPTTDQPANVAAAAHVEVQPDPETYERVLAEQLAQGKDRRVADGLAKRAGIIEARKKAAGG